MMRLRRTGAAAWTAVTASVLAAAMIQGAAAQESNQQADLQDNQPNRALTAAYNESGQQLFKQFAKTPGNIVFSPYSIGTAMAMVLTGARGETEREMTSALKQSLARAGMDAANAAVLSILNGYDKSAAAVCPAGMQLNDKSCESAAVTPGQCSYPAYLDGNRCMAEPTVPRSATLSVANALMLSKLGALMSKDYAALLRDQYSAEIFENVTLDDVNGWVKRKTQGKIDGILDRLDPTTAAVILNAVYFKAKWASVFAKGATRDDAFNLSKAETIKVPMMRKVGPYALVAGDGYRALRMPYEVPALAMIVVLPDDIAGLAQVSDRLGDGEWASTFAKLRSATPRPVDLMLPRFKNSFRAGLVPLFKQAGMKLAYDPDRADFSGMTGRPRSQAQFAIGEILHRAMIDVMEDGTEAAAVTAVTVRATSAPTREVEPEVFRVDRPFLYYIVDDATGAILFQGRLADPRGEG
jgi:serpin B